MSIMVIGATGMVGSEVVRALVARGADDIRAMSRNGPEKDPPDGVKAVAADTLDPKSMRLALHGVKTLFLLNPVVPDELARSLLTLSLARDVGIERFVYLSMLKTDSYLDVPHASAKFATERMITGFGLPTTVLRPVYFYQNDRQLKVPILTMGSYPTPIGGVGADMIDIRDLADLAAVELMRRDGSPTPLDSESIEVAGPDRLTGESAAALWSEVASREVSYGGDDLRAFEKQMSGMVPAWQALDIALMFGGFRREGMLATAGAHERVAELIGRPLRSYRAFAEELMEEWHHSPADLAGRVGETASAAVRSVRDLAQRR